MLRQALVHVAGILLSVVLVASPAWADRADDTITVTAPWKIGAMTPPATGAVMQRMGLTEPLTQPGENGRIEGLLAESWTADDDLTVWRFRLRSGVRFHDGAPLTAEAVAMNLNRFKDESALRKAPVKTISFEGDEVVVELDRPFAPLPAYLAHWSTGILAPASLVDNAKTVSGTGFYKLAGRNANQELVLETNDDYWGAKPEIDHARYVYAPEAATRLAMLRAGEAELAFGLKANAAAGGARDGFEIRSEATPRVRALKINVGIEPFSDLRVRKAISSAIDREGIAAALLDNRKTAATQLLPPSVADWHQSDLAPFAHDPALARTLLEEAGWGMGPDNVLQKNGTPFEVELLAYDARPELPEIATAVQAQLAEIGIKVTIKPVDWTAIPARHDDKTLEMAMVSDGFAYIPNPIGALAENYTQGGATWGTLDWHSEDFDRLVDSYQATSDEGSQEAIRRRMMEIVHDELPIITITWYDETFAISDAIKGFVFDPFEMRYGLNRVSWSQ